MKRETIREKYIDRIAVAVLPFTAYHGVEIIEDDFNCPDAQVVAAFYRPCHRDCIRVHNVHYTSSGRAYIWKLHKRYYLDEFMRTV